MHMPDWMTDSVFVKIDYCPQRKLFCLSLYWLLHSQQILKKHILMNSCCSCICMQKKKLEDMLKSQISCKLITSLLNVCIAVRMLKLIKKKNCLHSTMGQQCSSSHALLCIDNDIARKSLSKMFISGVNIYHFMKKKNY